jgi:protein-disulfide isomerase
VGACAMLLWLVSTVSAQTGEAPEPDEKTVRFVKRAIAYYPNSVFELVSNERYTTPSGSYRLVEVQRTCDSRILTGKPTVLVDEIANTAWLGSVAELPPVQDAGLGPDAIKAFIENFLPGALKASMNLKVEIEWDAGPRRPGALIPMSLLIDSGYGFYRAPAAVTAEGKFLVMGTEMPRDEDPVAVRRRRLAESKVVMWDTESNGEAKLDIVEFSDYECPACKGKWPLIKQSIEKHGSAVRHGMVSFPLTTIHPWAFRAASASWCVAEQSPSSLISFKETFYSLQREMQVSEVTPTSIDFVAGNGLDETAFRSCYLREPSLDAVHRQMSLGQIMAVRATPTYFVNGWLIQVPNDTWFPDFLETLLRGEEP